MNETLQVAGAMVVSHSIHETYMVFMPNECYFSTLLNLNFCHSGIYDSNGNLFQSPSDMVFSYNGHEIEIITYLVKNAYAIYPHIFQPQS